MGITLPDTRVCAVAGRMTAGMDCAQTGTPATSELSFSEMVEFLEPQLEFTTPEGVHFPAREAAVCQSAADYEKIKTIVEQACLKITCTKEVKETIKQVSLVMGSLQNRVMEKRKKNESTSPPVVHPIQHQSSSRRRR